MLPSRVVAVVALALLVLAGCHQARITDELALPMTAARLDPPLLADPQCTSDVAQPYGQDVSTVASPEAPKRFVSLAECVALSLENGRTGTFYDRLGSDRRSSVSGLSRQGSASGATDNVRVFAYDPAIAAMDVAQSEARFDVVWNTNFLFNRIDQPSRILAPTDFQTLQLRNRLDYGEFQTGLLKPLPTGGVAGLQFRETYEWQPGAGDNIVNPAYRPFLNLTLEQPLLRGSGLFMNELRDVHPGGVRTPLPPSAVRVPGILLARIGAEQTKLDFERRLQEVVFAVEEAYWGLYCAYWELNSRENALKQAHAAWKVAKARFDAGGIGIEDLAMIEEQYHFFRGQRLDALGRGAAGRPGVLEAERRLRYVVGLPAEDGTRLIPSDYPRTVAADVDWQGAYAEARRRRPELRQVQEEIRAVELLLLRAKDQLLPDLRAFGRYGVNDIGTNVASGWNDLNFHEWEAGLQMQVPLGFREGHAEVTRAKHQLAQRFAFLRDQEAKLLFSLQRSYRDVVQLREEMQVRRSQRNAAEAQLKARFEKFRAGGDPKRPEASIDLLLRAQRNWADAVRDEYVAVCNYNVALSDFTLQKGTILECNNVRLAEGGAPPACAVPQASRFLRHWHENHTPALAPGELEQVPEPAPRQAGLAAPQAATADELPLQPVRFLPPEPR